MKSGIGSHQTVCSEPSSEEAEEVDHPPVGTGLGVLRLREVDGLQFLLLEDDLEVALLLLRQTDTGSHHHVITI